MFVWFAAAAFVAVVRVFDSPALDYRVVMLGAVLPVVEAATGGPLVLHTLVGSVALLALVMGATTGRRLVRRRWLGLPIGTFLHLVLDGTWSDADLFWWPLAGASFGGDQIPEVERIGVSLVLEGAGIVLAAWAWRRYGLADPVRRRRFVRSGQLDREVL